MDPKIVLTEAAREELEERGIDPKLFSDLYAGTTGGQPTLTGGTQLVVDQDDERTAIWVRGEGES
jgi:hypothetical protein